VIDALPSHMAGTMHVASAGDRGVVDEMELDSSEELEDQDEEDEDDEDEEEDEYAEAGGPRGAMAMFMPSAPQQKPSKTVKKRSGDEEEGDDYDNVPVTRGKKTKQAKRDKKLKQVGTQPMDEQDELVEAPFDFDAFQPIQESNMTPEPENFEFNY
jgi:hypothetical protein